MSLIVHLVVGEFDAVKADDLTHPRLPGARRVRVHVEPRGDAGVIRVPGHHPLRAVVHVPGGQRDGYKLNCRLKVTWFIWDP